LVIATSGVHLAVLIVSSAEDVLISPSNWNASNLASAGRTADATVSHDASSCESGLKLVETLLRLNRLKTGITPSGDASLDIADAIPSGVISGSETRVASSLAFKALAAFKSVSATASPGELTGQIPHLAASLRSVLPSCSVADPWRNRAAKSSAARRSSKSRDDKSAFTPSRVSVSVGPSVFSGASESAKSAGTAGLAPNMVNNWTA
jgi:hypothetical protein